MRALHRALRDTHIWKLFSRDLLYTIAALRSGCIQPFSNWLLATSLRGNGARPQFTACCSSPRMCRSLHLLKCSTGSYDFPALRTTCRVIVPWTFSNQLRPQHFLYFLPEPHGHGSLRPTLPELGAGIPG